MISFTGVYIIDNIICVILKWLTIYLMIASVIGCLGIIGMCNILRHEGVKLHGRKRKYRTMENKSSRGL